MMNVSGKLKLLVLLAVIATLMLSACEGTVVGGTPPTGTPEAAEEEATPRPTLVPRTGTTILAEGALVAGRRQWSASD